MDGVLFSSSHIPILRSPSAFPVPDRPLGGREEATDCEIERGKGETPRSRLLLVLHSCLGLSSRMGGTDDSDSRAKSHSLGPSTTWPKHNRVKVASRLSPRGVAFGVRVGLER